MTTKESVLDLISSLPDDVTIDGIMSELYVRRRIEDGLRELDDGQEIPHEEVRKRLARWLD